MGQALQWRYPQVLYARAPRPDPRSGRLPYTGRGYLAPMWREETGAPLRRQTRPHRVDRWDNPPPCRMPRPWASQSGHHRGCVPMNTGNLPHSFVS